MRLARHLQVQPCGADSYFAFIAFFTILAGEPHFMSRERKEIRKYSTLVVYGLVK